MNSSSHSRQETCNSPYNSRRAKQISFCVCDQTYHYYIYGARICPPTQSCHMGSIVISGGNHPGSMQFSFFAFWKLVCCWRDMDVPTRAALPPPPPPPNVFSWWILIFRTTKTKKKKIRICLCKPKKCDYVAIFWGKECVWINHIQMWFSVGHQSIIGGFLKFFTFLFGVPVFFFLVKFHHFSTKKLGNFLRFFFSWHKFD